MKPQTLITILFISILNFSSQVFASGLNNLGLLGFRTFSSLAKKPSSTRFFVTPKGLILPAPKGTNTTFPAVNAKGNITGVVFKGQNGRTLRLMNPTPAKNKGKIKAYPQGYAVFENNRNQAINPNNGKTLSRDQAHIPIE